jgi:tetratricopeptide (TPR) repeat protein
LAVAEAGGGDPALLDQARLLVEADPDAAVASITAAARPGDWVWSALGLASDHPAVADALRAAVPRWLPELGPVEGADLLYVAARLAPAEQQPALFGAAAALLSSGLSGDDALDRGHWVGLAHLYADSGRPDRAVALLQRAASVYPDEFTFHYALAGHLRDQGDLEAAGAAARAAVDRAYGDNRLRAVGRLAGVLADQGDVASARALLDEALAAAVRPDDGTRVRTFRYLDVLETQRAALDAEGH